MKNFTFQNETKIEFGKESYKKLPEQLKKDGIKKILMVYGRNSIKKIGLYDTLINDLKDSNIEVNEISGVQPNPRLSLVKEGLKIFKEKKCQAILAVGGGSVIDTSKAISAGYFYDGDIWDLFAKKAPVEEGLPIYTILTLSATGSEMNGNAVITKEETKQKWDISSKALFPVVSYISPELQFSLPKSQTINGGVDAISHVMEFYFDTTPRTEIQDALAEGIIKTVIKATETLIEDPEDYQCRAALAWGATLALNGLLATGKQGGDWSSHMIEHGLSAVTDVAHGKGLAIIFPAFLEFSKSKIMDKLDRFAEKIFGIDTGNKGYDSDLAIKALKDWYRKIGQPVKLKEIGLEEEKIKEIAKNASQISPFGQIQDMNEKEILEVLKIAYK
ncbi:MAG: iron-containing alcohol dehydrogenase [Thermotogota bacterium]